MLIVLINIPSCRLNKFRKEFFLNLGLIKENDSAMNRTLEKKDMDSFSLLFSSNKFGAS